MFSHFIAKIRNPKDSPHILAVCVILGFFLRLYGLYWDSGYHFHPDERMLIMVADRIHFFTNLNPDFFNYGSFPLYLLRGTAQIIDWIFHTRFASYDGMLIVGRFLSTAADCIVIFLVYKIAQKLTQNRKIAIWSAFFYTIAFFPIQNSHFFVVDVYLNLFATFLVYLLMTFHEKHSMKTLIFISFVYAAALTTKVSALIFFPTIVLALVLPEERSENLFGKAIRFLKGFIPHKNPRNWVNLIIFGVLTILSTMLFMPYGYIEYRTFLNDIALQMRMNSDAYIFPYTLQYVGTWPYLYYLKNIFLWGVGPCIGLFAFLGSFLYVRALRSTRKTTTPSYHLSMIFFTFYILYFLVMGRSSVKFMRYMLLIYPCIAIMAGYGYVGLIDWLKSKYSNSIVGAVQVATYVFCALWTCMFLAIYSVDNTRVRATQWINQFITPGSTLAVEHWDDRVPIFDNGKYRYVELPLYDQPDDDKKWLAIYEKLKEADYIIIASNRLYTPLQRLHACGEGKKRCYPTTAKYYENLLSGRLNFVKIAQFTSYPRITFFGQTLRLRDDSADESFTVYDHPKIMIFKKT